MTKYSMDTTAAEKIDLDKKVMESDTSGLARNYRLLLI